jgi:hypothetical protein
VIDAAVAVVVDEAQFHRQVIDRSLDWSSGRRRSEAGMRHHARVLSRAVALCMTALLLTGCTGSSGSASINASASKGATMAKKIIEIHIPLVATPGLSAGQHQFPWIDQVESYVEELDPATGAEYYDDGEELGDDYIFFITGQDEQRLLQVAGRIVALAGVPAGGYAVVTDDQSDMGEGRRVELPVR